ncbi:MAG TPA: chemotaxis-specific protein-glutamate methyltransferase CheB [Syntrophomonadaceae bacterium]|nr:chemotaxis-specific protein-glutamate methyltransferase CheB [Syntrophomonadaceae bacterium]
MSKLNVLIVDKNSEYSSMLTEAVMRTGMAGRVDTVSSGEMALAYMDRQNYDVVVIDVGLSAMKGIQILQDIKRRHPSTRIIISSAREDESRDQTVQALEMGAVDFIVKKVGVNPEQNIEKIRQRLKQLFVQFRLEALQKTMQGYETRVRVAPGQQTLQGFDLLLIASSTGGPAALKTICSQFQSVFPIPVLIVQHMPAGFTRSMAQSLNKDCVMKVVEASEGDLIRPGQIYVAPGSYHMLVRGDRASKPRIQLQKSEMVNGVRPAADVLFKSVARVYQGANILAVVLTGMGSDGSEGVRALKETCRCYCLVQNEASSVVYGMPKSVVDAGLADEILDIKVLPRRIEELVCS